MQGIQKEFFIVLNKNTRSLGLSFYTWYTFENYTNL